MDPNQGIYGYFACTYDPNKLRGRRIEGLSKYNIQANAIVPITPNETIDMNLFTDKSNKILSFTMQYRDLSTNLNIRSDYGHGPSFPHIDIEQRDQNDKKVIDIDIPQVDDFLNYESAINAVLMQVEKYNPLVGLRYWLFPGEINADRIPALYRTWKEAGLKTPLVIFSWLVNIQVYEQSRSRQIEDTTIMEIAKTQIEVCRTNEIKQKGPLDIASVTYSTPMATLPFFFFVPDHEGIYVQNIGFMEDGSGVAFETKDGRNIIRDLDDQERRIGGT
ncbi:MAG: hypothetical protein WA941_01840 [Nitrososphaeraceae archaeon]